MHSPTHGMHPSAKMLRASAAWLNSAFSYTWKAPIGQTIEGLSNLTEGVHSEGIEKSHSSMDKFDHMNWSTTFDDQSEEKTSSLQLELLSEQNSGITKSSSNSYNSREDEHAIHGGKVPDDHHQEIQKLPLFVEESTTNDNNYKSEKKSTEKLDLKLRLGPDPNHDKSRLSTQEFF
ncbi:hypothetical protein FNV43_RR09823 [Rhamnella rubrinervis]|uniref:Uncharacterized protein n=1 Tax=Rhamnella rubrinervis TaxID=2594499 RepID=A0A8K0HBZ8_9ROSA|nr:hypothetical protein FNV43_RR09823 [Rhamnella rubrinervis]